MAVDQILLLMSGTTWVVPNDWNNAHNTIELIAGGGGASEGTPNTQVDGAGAGGAWSAILNQTLTPGSTVAIAIGAAGAAATAHATNGTAGTDTWLASDNTATTITSGSVVVGAKGGSFGVRGGGVAAGGAAASGVGAYKVSGGIPGTASGGGPGGGGAGNSAQVNGHGANGTNASTGTGGTGTNGWKASGGGTGGTTNNNGSAGTSGSGGGGGGGSAGAGSTHGGDGGPGDEWSPTAGGTAGAGGGGGGSGGGAGSGSDNTSPPANGGLYGGGGGAAWAGYTSGGGQGAQGAILVSYSVNGTTLSTSLTDVESATGILFFGTTIGYTRVVAGATGVVLDLTISVDTALATASHGMAIYSDSGGVPGSLLAHTQPLPISGTGHVTFNLFNGPTVTQGTAYWLAVINNAGGTVKYKQNTGSITNKNELRSGLTWGATATNATGTGNLWMQMGINATPSAGGTNNAGFFFGI